MKLPKSTSDALAATANAMLVPLGIPTETVAAGVDALVAIVSGETAAKREPLDRVLTIREAASIIHKTPKTLRALVLHGKLRAVHFGEGKRASGITESSLRAFLAGKEVA